MKKDIRPGWWQISIVHGLDFPSVGGSMCISSGRALLIIALIICNHAALAATPDGRPVSDAQITAGQKPSGNGTISSVNPGEIVLHWTAPGDDSYVGRARRYEMHYQPFFFGPIDTQDEWNRATPVSSLPVPSPAGWPDSVVVSGLSYGGGYYFCIRAFDESGNTSELSNSPLLVAGDTTFIPGDVNGSGVVNGIDVTYLVNYFKGGSDIPAPILRADANGSCIVNGLDVVYLKCYFCGGPPPIRGSCGVPGAAAK